MPKLSNIWSKLRWSLAHRGLRDTLRVALRRGITPAREQPRLQTHPFDQRYGVDTSGLIGGGDLHTGHKNDVFNTAYYAMAPSRFRRIMEQWIEQWIVDETHPPLDHYTFIDLGCGKGRAVLMASEFHFRQSIGVELHPGLAKAAEANVSAWTAAGRALCPIYILCQDAAEFAFPDGPCLLYLFNPFTTTVLSRVIDRLTADFTARPRPLDVIYFNPEAAEIFETHQGFRCIWTGTVEMSQEDAAADWVASPGDLCSIYSWVGKP